MARDFESLIVDPSLVDPSIDATNLRTTTDTREELLSDVPEFQGIQFDPTQTSYLDDLYALYSGQLPMTPIPTVTASNINIPLPGGGGGGGTPATGSGGQATGSTTISPTTQPVDPSGMLPQISSTIQPTTGGITTDPISVGIPDNESGFVDPLGTMGGAPGIFDVNQTGDPSLNPGSTMAGEPTSGFLASGAAGGANLPSLAGVKVQGGLSTTDAERLAGYTPSTSIAPETEGALSQAFRKGKEALDSGVQTISQVGQNIADSVKGTYNDLNRTVNVPGLGDIDVGKTLGGLAVNALVGAPVSFVKAAIDQIPPSASQLEYEGYTNAQKAAVDEAFGPGGSMEGYNAVSQFGTPPAETIQNRIDSIKNRKAPQTDASKQKIKDLQEDYNKITSGSTIISPNIDEEEGRPDDPGGPSGLDTITGPNIDEEEGRPEDPGGNDSSGPTDSGVAPGTGAEGPAGGATMSGPSDDFADDFDDYGGIGSITTGTLSGLGMLAKDGDGGSGPPSSGFSAPSQQGQSPRGSTTGGGGGDPGCFIKGTLITMADGSTKPVEQVDLEDEVAVGGKVFAVGRFLNTELYDYKGIKVSGSHMVNEDGVWMRVRDTKHGKSLGDDKNTVYVFGSRNRRILINNILFTDYFEVSEQDILIENPENFFNNYKSYGKIIDKQNVDILNAS
jgi:hypothetical protein